MLSLIENFAKTFDSIYSSKNDQNLSKNSEKCEQNNGSLYHVHITLNLSNS